MKTAVSTLVLTMFIAHGALAQDATIKQKQKPVPAKAASTSLPAAQKGGGAKSTAVKLGQPENKPLNTSTAQATVGSAAERYIECV
jgi:hypothetical protein